MVFLILALWMHDLKFEELTKYRNWKLQREAVLNSPACNKAKAVFGESGQLIDTLTMVPGYSFMNGESWGISVIRAMNELRSDNPDAPDVQARASKIWDEYDMGAIDQSAIQHFYEATQNAVKMACLPGRDLSFGALLSLLKSVLIQSWSAYELLTEQILTECKVSHANLFSPQIVNKRHRVRSESTLPVSYREVFGGDSAIDSAVWNPGVKGHALLRHLLVHSHGKVDDTHLKQRRLDPIVNEWDAYALVGDEIIIDGELVRRLVDRTNRAGYTLIGAVSDWIDARTP